MFIEPQRYLAEHPWAHALSLLGAAGACVYASVVAIRADEARRRWSHVALAVWTASNVVGLATLRRRDRR